MRASALILLSLAALPAAAQAQVYDPVRDAILRSELAGQQQLDRQRQVAVDNQLMTLEAQARANQALATIQQQSARPVIPLPILPPSEAGGGVASPAVDVSKLASIPDDRLAASNAAVRAVTQGH